MQLGGNASHATDVELQTGLACRKRNQNHDNVTND